MDTFEKQTLALDKRGPAKVRGGLRPGEGRHNPFVVTSCWAGTPIGLSLGMYALCYALPYGVGSGGWGARCRAKLP